MAVDKNKQFATGKKFSSTESGSADWWYGGSQVAWNSKQEAFDNIPEPKRSGLTIGVLESGNVVEYIWHTDTTDAGLILKSPKSSDNISSDSSKVLATSKAVKTVNDKVNNNTSDISDLDTNKISKPTTATPNPILFLNEQGNYNVVPQTQFKTVFVDADIGSDTTGQLQNKAKPFLTAQAALNALPTATTNFDNWIVNIVDDTVHTINTIPNNRITFKKESVSNFIIENNGVDDVLTPRVTGLGFLVHTFDMPNTSLILKNTSAGGILTGSYFGIHFNIRELKTEMISGIAIDLGLSPGITGFIANANFSHSGIRASYNAVASSPNNLFIAQESVLVVDNLILSNSSGNAFGISVYLGLSFKRYKVTVNNAISSSKINFVFGHMGRVPRNTICEIGNIKNVTLIAGGNYLTLDCKNSVFEDWYLCNTGLRSSRDVILTGTISNWVIEGSSTDIINDSLITSSSVYPLARFVWNVKVLGFTHNNPPTDISNLYLFDCYQGLETTSDDKGDIFLNAQFIGCPVGVFGKTRNGDNLVDYSTEEEALEATKLVLKGLTIIDAQNELIVPYLGGTKRIEVQGELLLGNGVNVDTDNVDIRKTFTNQGINHII